MTNDASWAALLEGCRNLAAHLGVQTAVEAGQHRERLRDDRRITRKGSMGDGGDFDTVRRNGHHKRLLHLLGNIEKIDVGLAVKHKDKLQPIRPIEFARPIES